MGQWQNCCAQQHVGWGIFLWQSLENNALPQWSCCSVANSCPTLLTPWTATHQAFLSFTISWSLLKLTSIESVMPPTISSSVVPFSSCLQSFPASGSSLMSQLFASGGQSIGASASVFPMNIQDWLSLGLTGLISLQSKGLNSLLQHHCSKASILQFSRSVMSDS